MGQHRNRVDEIETPIGIGQRRLNCIDAHLGKRQVSATPLDCSVVKIASTDPSAEVLPIPQNSPAATTKVEQSPKRTERCTRARQRRFNIISCQPAALEKVNRVWVT